MSHFGRVYFVPCYVFASFKPCRKLNLTLIGSGTSLAVVNGVNACNGREPMERVHRLWLRYGRLQPGQTMAEYGLIVALVAIVAISAWALLGTNIKAEINYIASCI